MAQSHLEIFPSEYHMLQFFGKYLPKLDAEASGRLSPFLYVYDDELVLARNLYEFLTQIEEMTALGIDTLNSSQKGTAFLIFFHDKIKSPEKFLESAEEMKASRSNVIVDDKPKVEIKPEELVQLTVPDSVVDENNAQEEVEKTKSSRSDEDKEAILAHAETLRNDSKKAAAKADLEAYALTLDISLSKGKTFDGMLEDLKAAL